MGIHEDVFTDFFDRLEKDADFPNELVRKLRKLWKSDKTVSKEKILNTLEGGIRNTSNNQDN